MDARASAPTLPTATIATATYKTTAQIIVRTTARGIVCCGSRTSSASVATRAQRRHKQLIDKGNHATLAALSSALEERDKRDAAREVAPLKPAADAVSLDSSAMTIDEVVDQVLEKYRERT